MLWLHNLDGNTVVDEGVAHGLAEMGIRDRKYSSYRRPSTPMRFSTACTSSVAAGNFSGSLKSSPSLYFPRFVT